MAVLLFLLFWVLLALLSTSFVAPFLIRSVARTVVGRHLKQSTQDRRRQIYQRARAEERSHSGKDRKLDDADAEWETIESYAAGTARNGQTGNKDWDGIVGFFHPFWYVLSGQFPSL